MSDFQGIDGVIGHQAIAETSTTQNHDLGLVMKAKDTASTAYGVGEFIYLKGVASTVVGSAVLIAEDGFTTSLLAANDIGQVAFAMSINVASSFGWYQINGKAVGKVLTGFADNGNCYGTATAGSLDDAVVAGDRVQRCKGASAIGTPSTGLADLEISYPEVNNALAD